MASIQHITMTETGSEPVSTDNLKDWLLIGHTDHDTLLASMGKAARQRVEAFCNISVIAKTVVLYVNLESGELYELPYGPVSSVTSVHVVEEDNTLTELLEADDDFYIIGAADSFKIIKSFHEGLHKITYVTGFVSTPETVKEAIMTEAAFRYEHRGDELTREMSEQAKDLAQPYMRVYL